MWDSCANMWGLLINNVDNIRYGLSNDPISEVAILKPAKLANVHSIFIGLPLGNNTKTLGRPTMSMTSRLP